MNRIASLGDMFQKYTMKSTRLTLAVFGCSFALYAAPLDVWFGTSTSRGEQGSKGIYHGIFDGDKGTLSPVTLAVEVGSPGFLAIHPDGKKLYAACKIGNEASVAAFAVHPGGKLELFSHQPIGDGGAAHLAVHPQGRMVVTAQYGGGSTAVFPLGPDGRLGVRSQLIKHEGAARVVGRRQDASHAHYVGFDSKAAFAFVPDLGLDAVVIYQVTKEGRALEPHGRAVVPPGGGPRHMKFHGDYAYVLNEMALSVTSFRYDGAGGMKQLSTTPSLSEEVKAQETFNSASEICVHPSGSFVYSANRGNDSITAYKANLKTGRLDVLEVEPIRGAWPRNFNLDPSGRWLLAAGKDSSTVTVFAIDQVSGKLSYPTRRIYPVPRSICILFGRSE